jgi:hypothetical protein
MRVELLWQQGLVREQQSRIRSCRASRPELHTTVLRPLALLRSEPSEAFRVRVEAFPPECPIKTGGAVSRTAIGHNVEPDLRWSSRGLTPQSESDDGDQI